MEDTKSHIIAVGADIIQHSGFNNTGIQEILKAAKVPKGSFYFYFKNKEDFGLQVIDYFSDYFLSFAGNILGDTSLPPLKRLQKLFDCFFEMFEANECTCGCPIGNLAQEMSDLNPVFREKLKAVIDSIVDCYAGILREAQERGELSKDQDVLESARFILSSCHGAFLHMKVAKSLDPLKNWNKFIMNCVLK